MMIGRIQKRLNRILLMVPFMAGEQGADVDELCSRFDIDREELLSDLEVLFLCGLPGYDPGDLIDYHLEGNLVFVSMADYFQRPLTLTREEALALFVAGRALIKAGVFGEDSSLASALDKVHDLLSEGSLIDVEDLSVRIDVEMDSYPEHWRRVIEEGLKQGKSLLLEYYSFSRGEVTSRKVEPLSLLWSKGHWYLHAWCRRAEEIRLFRLDRIKNVSLTGDPVRVSEMEEMEAPLVVGEYKPGKSAHHVKLRFAGREGRRIIEEWPTAKVTDNVDGSVQVVLRTRNLEWLSGYLLKFGGRLRIESPSELRKMVREKASRVLDFYA